MWNILVTGGAGYIGSHTCVELLERNFNVIVVDSLVNSHEESLRRVQHLSGRKLVFERGDIGDEMFLEQVFSRYRIDAVIHFAGLKAVGDSVSDPLGYYDNNVTGSLRLFQVMKKYHVKNIVFSSSATVYGDPAKVPITEDFPLNPTNPYGRTKFFIEEILRDFCNAHSDFKAIILRYFNPVGAHPSGLIGEDPQGKPNNLVPFISQVAVGRLPKLQIFGNDYKTPDGTGVRDYIHVVDLAKGHSAALRKLQDNTSKGLTIYNLGTGRGYSVLEVLNAMKKASEKEIPHSFAPRRPGDVAICYANPTKAEVELGWKAELGLEAMCRDAWNWQRANPQGFLKSLFPLPELTGDIAFTVAISSPPSSPAPLLSSSKSSPSIERKVSVQGVVFWYNFFY